MKRKIIMSLSVLAVLVILCMVYFYIIIYPYTLKGEVVYNDYFDSDEMLVLKVNPDSKFMPDHEVVFLYVGDTSIYKPGDKLFVYCTPVVEDSLPPGLNAKWIFRVANGRFFHIIK